MAWRNGLLIMSGRPLVQSGEPQPDMNFSIYYQHDPARVSTCPLTVHALLHIADSILIMGPVWCYWAFPMERFCGMISPHVRSRRFPWRSIDRFVLETSQIAQVRLLYPELERHLAFGRKRLAHDDAHGAVRVPGCTALLMLSIPNADYLRTAR